MYLYNCNNPGGDWNPGWGVDSNLKDPYEAANIMEFVTRFFSLLT